MIQQVDAALRQILIDEIEVLTEADQVTFGLPQSAEQLGKGGREKLPRVNFYLHDVRENLDLRENERQVDRRKDGLFDIHRPPTYLDLRYLVTAQAADPEAAHALLSEVLRTLLRHDRLSWEEEEDGEARKIDFHTAVAQPDLLVDTARFPEVVGAVRPAVNLVVTGWIQPYPKSTVPYVTRRVLRFFDRNSEALLDVSDYEVPSAIIGFVFDNVSGQPISGATVTLGDTPRTRTTDQHGFYYFTPVPPGENELHVAATGYEPGRVTVTMTEEQEEILNTLVTLSPVDVTSSLARKPSTRSRQGKGQ